MAHRRKKTRRGNTKKVREKQIKHPLPSPLLQNATVPHWSFSHCHQIAKMGKI